MKHFEKRNQKFMVFGFITIFPGLIYYVAVNSRFSGFQVYWIIGLTGVLVHRYNWFSGL